MATAPDGPFLAIAEDIPAAEAEPSTCYPVPVDPKAVGQAFFRVIVEKR